MRLNGSTINGVRLGVGVQLFHELLAVDAVAVAVAELPATRVRSLAGDATSIAVGDFLASAQRYGSADFIGSQHADVTPSVVRNGSGSAIAVTQGGLFYTRVIYGSGGAQISIIAISDVGVVYGDGSGVMVPYAEMSGRRAKIGFGEAIAETFADLPASAIRTPATMYGGDSVPLAAFLDTAHVTGGGVRYINGSGDAIGYLNLEDNGLKRQVIIGSLDLEPIAVGHGSAIRNAVGVAQIETSTSFAMLASRRAEGAGIIYGAASLDGQILVPGSGVAVISLIAQLTGSLYRRGAILEAINEIAVELSGLRARVGRSDAQVSAVTTLDGARLRLGSGDSIVIINADSAASDYNFSGLDDEDEIFFRPASQREFARPADIREWRRL